MNCNSTKKDKAVEFSDHLLPDRDNTFFAYKYEQDGSVQVADALLGAARRAAEKTLALTGLDKSIRQAFDENGSLIAQDRSTQRMEAWLVALCARADFEHYPQSVPLARLTLKLAAASGSFSIWMTVFEDVDPVRRGLIEIFRGTAESGCFDATGISVSPCPNMDALDCGGRC